MLRSKQHMLLAIIFIALLTSVAGCGVSDTGNHPRSQADQKTTILPTITTASSSPEHISSQALTATAVAWGQAIDATKVAAMEHGGAAVPNPQTSPLTSTTTLTMTARVVRVPTAGSITRPHGTPYSTAATPIPGTGTLYGRDISAFPSDTFLGRNAWSYDVNTIGYYVYAGRQGHGPNHDQDFNQGMLVVRIIDIPSDTTRSTTFYKTPRSDGPARIVDVQIQAEQINLTIATEGGSLYLFNLNSGTFSPAPSA